MSNKITILPESLVSKIAAGEVVERPASVVKELVENAIDAWATKITVEVAAGGKQLVRVADNGVGMSHGDALLAFERHSTSKISDASDLRSISTLGFRGEALSSISAVSRTVLETRQVSDLAGTRVTVEGGVIKDVAELGRDVGTTVTVRNLFFSTPARRKFLRGTDAEMRQVSRYITTVALAYPEIGFVLLHNGREVLRLERRVERKARLEDVFGRDLIDQTLPLNLDEGDVRITGFIGMPEIARRSRVHQAFFVNGRCISNKALSNAVYAGYGGSLLKDTYPFFVIFLEVDPEAVDVNVHPTKREVRFSDDRRVHDLLVAAVRTSLDKNIIEAGRWTPTDQVIQVQEPAERYAVRSDEGFGAQISLPLAEKRHLGAGGGAEDEEGLVSLWQLHQKYIFAHIKNGLIIVDQHLAHERVIYEDVMRNFSGQGGAAQQQLFPVTLEFSLPEFEVLKEIMPLLEQIGFGIREFGRRGTVVVDATPADLGRWADGEVLRAMVDDMVEIGKVSLGVREKLAASYACHTSIKAGEKLSPAEMQGLIDRLFATDNPFICPHGRPIVVRMSLEEIDRRFRR